MTLPVRSRRLPAWLAVLVLACACAGCFNPFDPRVSQLRAVSSPAPAPTSPANVVKLFEWCWQNKSIDQYSEIFTDDYRFQFAQGDSAGNIYRDRPITREDELISARNLFVGGTDRAPASSITLHFDNTLIALGDTRPGKNPKWHKSIRTHVDLNVVIPHDDGSTETNQVTGFALFFLVRGDSAAIPKELRDRGFTPDSTRWWIERWEDETLPSGGGSPAMAARRASLRPAGRTDLMPFPTSWGALKSRFGL